MKVSDELDLIEVAVQLSEDNARQFEQWLEQEKLDGVNDEQAALWLQEDRVLWAVVADPWVLVQERKCAA
ncbi:hypothetical protein NOR53_258 [gamma proteobacterium NOR5-3]|nr:hypothetical protein NOR53_258 [gamma proteobacterium NOR5-3]